MIGEENQKDEADHHLNVSDVESCFGHMNHPAQHFVLLRLGIPKGVHGEIGEADAILVFIGRSANCG